MQQLGFTGEHHPDRMPLARHWVVLFAVALLSAGIAEFIEAGSLAGAGLDQLFSERLTGYAHLMIGASTVLYLAQLRARGAAIGRWASSLAALAALCLLGTLAVRATEAGAARQIPLTSMHEVMVLFNACTLLVYLAMERAYRSRAAGALVLPVVLAAVAVESWLTSGGATRVPGQFPVLHSYTVLLHVLLNLLAYGAFAVAAAMGLLYLLEARGATAGPGGARIERIEQLSRSVLRFGFMTFSVAILLGMQAAHDRWGRYWGWTPKETWSLLVWINSAAYLLFGRGRRGGARSAWWSMAGFALALLCFLGVNLLAARMHAYG